MKPAPQILAVVLSLLVTAATQGDVAVPGETKEQQQHHRELMNQARFGPPKPGPSTKDNSPFVRTIRLPLVIEAGPEGTGPRLHIPKKALEDLVGRDASVPVGARNSDAARGFPVPITAAGAILALSLACAGLCWARPRRRLVICSFTVLIGAASFIGISCIHPDPDRINSPEPMKQISAKTITGQVTVDIEENGDGVQLSVDPQTLVKLKGKGPAR